MKIHPRFLAIPVLFASLSATSAFAATVDFATLSGPNGSPFTTYTENGFQVSTASGSFFDA